MSSDALLADVAVTAEDPRDAVWTALTTGIANWWPAEFYCGGRGEADGPKPRMRLDARVGGLMWEDWDEGEGLAWGTVVQCRRGYRLDIVGDVGPDFGGPNRWFGTFTLEDGPDDTTRVRFQSSGFGHIRETCSAEVTKGWQFLLDCLAAFLDDRAPPSHDS